MKRAHPARPAVLAGLLALALGGCARTTPPAPASATPAPMGPLVVHKENGRYFADAAGIAVLLTGSHTWNNLVDMGESDPPAAFDFDKHLAFLTAHHHNFIRLWAWETSTWNTEGNKEKRLLHVLPHPWKRMGSLPALDGKPRFSLDTWNPVYFDRLRARVQAARHAGIYVSVMLFEGWSLQFAPGAWESHPFHAGNNGEGIDGDANKDGSGVEIHELVVPEVTRQQEAYVRKVVDTLNDLDNVLYEISNENHPASTEWQYHMIRYLSDYQKTRPFQHPIGMTYQYKGGTNDTLFASPADWISINKDGGYKDEPPAGDGRKVILSDTDHLWGIGGTARWVWQTVTRGHNPLFMDPMDGSVLLTPEDFTPLRHNMGAARKYTQRMDLAHSVPDTRVASSGYCLAVAGRQYLVFVPGGGDVTLDLGDAKGEFQSEWFDPATLTASPGPTVTGGEPRTYASAASKDTVLFVWR